MGQKLFSKDYAKFFIDVIRLEFRKGLLSFSEICAMLPY